MSQLRYRVHARTTRLESNMAKHQRKRLVVGVITANGTTAASIKLRVGSWRVGIIIATPGRVS